MAFRDSASAQKTLASHHGDLLRSCATVGRLGRARGTEDSGGGKIRNTSRQAPFLIRPVHPGHSSYRSGRHALLLLLLLLPLLPAGGSQYAARLKLLPLLPVVRPDGHLIRRLLPLAHEVALGELHIPASSRREAEATQTGRTLHIARPTPCRISPPTCHPPSTALPAPTYALPCQPPCTIVGTGKSRLKPGERTNPPRALAQSARHWGHALKTWTRA